MQSPKNILVKMPNWLGDLVMATPVLADLRRQWPEASITAMCQANVASVLKHDPNVTEIFSYHKPSGWIPHCHHWKLISDIRKGHYDMGILLTNSFSTAWWFWLGGVKNRIGFEGNARSLFLNKAVPFPKERETQHLVITYKQLLAPLGIPLSNTAPQLYISPEEQQTADDFFKKCGVEKGKTVLYGINPGAAYGSAKCWLPDRYRAVTEKLLEDPLAYVVYFGDPAGAPLVNSICEDLPSRVINLAGKTTIRELMALMNCCSVILTNDSGPMHMAAALNLPLVALFGSTSDIKTGPYGIGKVIHKHVECSPCYKRVCPIDFRCMKRIEVDEVYNELQKQLKLKNGN